MQPGWIPQIFETCELGVSTAFEPELIPDNQLVWMKNGVARGGKASNRPFLKERLVLPTGKIQGVSYFSIQKGMLIMQISGRLYRVRIANKSFSWEEIALPFNNSAAIPEVWMQETVGSLIVQDGQSYAIIYDGSTARRSDPAKKEVPMGRMMAFGNGRLWIAINDNELIAGDIKTKVFQSELKFTEGQYFSGGGAFYFPFAQRGLAFIPASGAAGYGSLMVFGEAQMQGVRADIASRDLWPDFPGFIQPVLLSSGAISQFSIVEANQDLFWRDGNGGIRSVRSSATSEISGPGNVPLSREVARITDFESVHRLNQCSAIQFNNRLLMTASPFINIYGTTSYKNLISMDFAPMSSLRGKAPPAYDGQWEGLNFVRLVQGQFQSVRRAFAVTTDDDGHNRLWEISDSGRADSYEFCDDGVLTTMSSPVPMVLEYPSRSFGDSKRRKRLERCDVYLAGLDGESELSVYWRADNYQKWSKWDDVSECAQTTDPATNSPHAWKNLLNQERPQTKTFSIPAGMNDITERALHVGFEFQTRIVLRGKGKIFRTVIYASMLDEEQFADRDDSFADCVQNDITGNEIYYALTPTRCPPIVLLDVNVFPTGLDYGRFGPTPGTFYNPNSADLIFNSAFPFGGLAIWQNTGPADAPTGRVLLTSISYSDIIAAKADNEGIIDITSLVHALTGPVSLFFTAIGFYDYATELSLNANLSGDVDDIDALNFVNAPNATAPITFHWVELRGPGFTLIEYKDDLGGIFMTTPETAGGKLVLVCNIPVAP